VAVSVRLLPVVLALVFLAVVVAVHYLVVLMLVRMPVGAMLPLSRGVMRVVVRNVIVVVCVTRGGMRMLGLPANALCSLLSRRLQTHLVGPPIRLKAACARKVAEQVAIWGGQCDSNPVESVESS
jgi:hypothetical protein